MDKQAREAREMAKNLPFKERVRHFWDYYKIHTIASLVAAVIICTTIYQMVTRERFDLEIVYYGNAAAFTQEQADILSDYLSGYVDDIDDNNEIKVSTIVAGGLGGSENSEYQMAISQKFMAEISAGVYHAYIFDKEFYDYAGPGSEMSVFDNAFNLCENEEIKAMLGLGDEPIYWCTRVLYEREAGKEDSVAVHNNAVLAEKAVRGERD